MPLSVHSAPVKYCSFLIAWIILPYPKCVFFFCFSPTVSALFSACIHTFQHLYAVVSFAIWFARGRISVHGGLLKGLWKIVKKWLWLKPIYYVLMIAFVCSLKVNALERWMWRVFVAALQIQDGFWQKNIDRLNTHSVCVHGSFCISWWISFKLNLCMVVFLSLILLKVLFWPCCMFSGCAFDLLNRGINVLGRARLVVVVFWNFKTVDLVLCMEISLCFNSL